MPVYLHTCDVVPLDAVVEPGTWHCRSYIDHMFELGCEVINCSSGPGECLIVTTHDNDATVPVGSGAVNAKGTVAFDEPLSTLRDDLPTRIVVHLNSMVTGCNAADIGKMVVWSTSRSTDGEKAGYTTEELHEWCVCELIGFVFVG